MRRRSTWAASAATLALACLAALPAAAEWGDWIAEADLGFEYDSNLNNAVFDSDKEYGLTWRPEGRVGRGFYLAEDTRLDLVAEVRGEIYHRWSQLNSVAGDGQVSLSHKFGLGDAPWARVFIAGGYEGVRDGERGGARFEVGGQVGKRFSPRFDGSLTYRFMGRRGDDGLMVGMFTRTDVWDQDDHEIGVDGRFLLTDQLVATAGYEFRHGDLYSNARTSQAFVLVAADVKAVAWDNVFGGWAYRVNGNAHSPFVSLNYGLGDHWSIDASYRFRYAKSGSLDYTNQITQLTILFRY